MGFFSKGFKNEFERTMVNEPAVLVYCMFSDSEIVLKLTVSFFLKVFRYPFSFSKIRSYQFSHIHSRIFLSSVFSVLSSLMYFITKCNSNELTHLIIFQ